MENLLAHIKELLIQKKYQDAYALFSKENNALFHSTQGLNLFGICARGLGRPQASIKAYIQSLKINNTQAGIWTNLGNAYKDIAKYESAIQCHQMANQLTQQKDALILHNLGIAYSANNEHQKAVDAYEQALALVPDRHELLWDISRSQLALFNYEEGWKYYKARWLSEEAGPRKYEAQPWQGQKLNNKSIFVYCDQGFGDYIQCFRYIHNLLEEAPAKLYLEVKKELKTLVMQTIGEHPVIEVIDYRFEGQTLDYDYAVAITDLPIIYAKNYPSLASHCPYITVKAANHIPQDIFETPKIKIGIVWTGSLTFKRNKQRSPDIRYFVENLNLPHVQLYSLQKGEKVAELNKYSRDIINLDPYISHYADTAACIEKMDRVVSMCTSVAHLCGALDKSCWVALDYTNHWLWGVNEDASRWYPSIRLFKQKTPGDWYSVFDNMQAELLKEFRATLNNDHV